MRRIINLFEWVFFDVWDRILDVLLREYDFLFKFSVGNIAVIAFILTSFLAIENSGGDIGEDTVEIITFLSLITLSAYIPLFLGKFFWKKSMLYIAILPLFLIFVSYIIVWGSLYSKTCEAEIRGTDMSETDPCVPHQWFAGGNVHK